jgi:hypothetical protein
MAKKLTKKLSYKDFLQPTLSDLPSKLYLSSEDGLTEFHLEVLSSKNPKVKRAVTAYGLAEQDVYIKANEVEDKVDRILQAQDENEPNRKELAMALVVGGNFDEFIKVLDNPLNCDAVIARAYSTSEYAVKK